MNRFKQYAAGILLFAVIPTNAIADIININTAKFDQLNQSITQESLAGKIIYVDFWASWCKPCFKSFPWMYKMQEKYAVNGLQIIAVNLDKEASLSENFLKKAPANFDLVFDNEALLAEQFKVKAMPSSYLFGRDGSLQASHLGFQEKNKELYEKELRILLGLQ